MKLNFWSALLLIVGILIVLRLLGFVVVLTFKLLFPLVFLAMIILAAYGFIKFFERR